MPFDLKPYVINRQGKDMVLYVGLLALSHDRGLRRIATSLVQAPHADNGQVAICHAEVELVSTDGVVVSCQGLGDASPENVGKNIVPHIIRMAETRAKARALRDALNITMLAAEELADDEPAPTPTPQGYRQARQAPAPARPANGHAKPTMAESELSRTPEGQALEREAKFRRWHAHYAPIAREHGRDERPIALDAPLETVEQICRDLKAWLDEQGIATTART